MQPINPLQSFMQGAQVGHVIGGGIGSFGGGIMQQQANAQAQAQAEAMAAAEAEKQAKLRESMLRIYKGTPTVEDYVNMITSYKPEQLKEINATIATKTSEDRAAMAAQTGGMLSALRSGDIELVKKLGEQQVQALKNSGQEKAAGLFGEMLARIDDPVGKATFDSALGTNLAITEEGRKWLKAMDDRDANLRAQAEEGRKVALAPEDLRTKQLDNQKKEAEIEAIKLAKKYSEEGKLLPEEATKAENELRKEYNSSPVVQALQTVKGAYSKILGTEKTAPGDMSLIFSYMKMLDPGSTVREGEFATAQNAGGLDTTIRNIYNKALTGEMLTDAQRDNFKSQAGKLFDSAKESEKIIRQGITGIANRKNLNLENIFYEGEVSKPVKTAKKSPSIVTEEAVIIETPKPSTASKPGVRP